MWLREFDFLCMHGGRKNQSGEGEEGKDDDDDVDQWLNGVIDSHTTINRNYLDEEVILFVAADTLDGQVRRN